MIDLVVDTFAEIADFFINLWVDEVLDKFTKRNKS